MLDHVTELFRGTESPTTALKNVMQLLASSNRACSILHSKISPVSETKTDSKWKNFILSAGRSTLHLTFGHPVGKRKENQAKEKVKELGEEAREKHKVEKGSNKKKHQKAETLKKKRNF